jgi:quercetin dioxygenase-like cupin family protein
MAVISSIVEFKAGAALPEHFHHAIEAADALQGALLQSPGKEPAMIATGSAIMNLRDVVHILDKNKALYDSEKPKQ